MLTGLKMINYRSHRRSIFEFVPGVNVIVGPSDAGKSSVRRAIEYLNSNRPTSKRHKSDWGGRMCIEAKTSDGLVVSREDGEEKKYKLGKLEFHAFGTDVPKEITDALRLDEVNIQHQANSHFLFNISPGEVARYFNKVAKLENIDIGQQNIEKWIRDINADINFKTVELKKEIDKLKEYEDLEKIEMEVEVLEILEEDIHQKDRSILELTKLIDSTEKLENDLIEFEAILSVEDEVDSILRLFEEVRNLDGEIGKIDQILISIEDLNAELDEIDVLLELEDLINETVELYQEEHDLDIKIDQIDYIIEHIEMLKGDLKEMEEIAERLHAEFDREFPDTCPLCGKEK